MSIGKFSNSKKFVAKGTRNRSAFPKKFIDICKMAQCELRPYLYLELRNAYEEVILEDGFIYARGGDVVVTAHMDTVHKEEVQSYYGWHEKGKNYISSPQGIGGDDRCGIYMILQIIENGYRPTVLFCEDEEIGGVGSNKFVATPYINELKEKKFMIELDRANANDLVFYDDDNEAFHDWCAKITGYKAAYGSFSDISHLCPKAEVSGVNISCGYYNAHTTSEYVCLEEMDASIDAAVKMIEASDDVEQFTYVDGWSLGDFYKYEDGYIYGNSSENAILEVMYYDEMKREETTCITGTTIDECWVTFFIENPSTCWNDIFDWNEMFM